MMVAEGQIRSFDNDRMEMSVGIGICHAYFAVLAELFLHDNFPRRLAGRSLRMMTLRTVMWAALGFAIGCRTTAGRLMQLLIESLNRDFFFDREYYPIFYFVLRLFADWKGIELQGLPEVARREMILNELLERWREPESTELAASMIAVCDYHTHRCRTNTAKEFYEFDDGLFTHFPVEILMLYRLREYVGLTVPKVDHPLLNTPLGKLPGAMSCEPDALLSQVLDRARSQGFDEEAIVHSILGNQANG